MKVQFASGPATRLYTSNPNPAKLFKDLTGTADLFGCREFCSVLAVDGTGRVAVAHLALADTLQQCPGSLHRRVFGGGVESPGVGLEVFTPGCGLKCRPTSYS